jgi:hypothetical protein
MVVCVGVVGVVVLKQLPHVTILSFFRLTYSSCNELLFEFLACGNHRSITAKIRLLDQF